MADLLGLLAGGGFVSGERLSRELGVTRAAVWKQIHALQDAGWRVIAMTKDQVFDEAAMDEAAAQLARALGVHGNGTEPRAMLLRRSELRNLLFS